MKLAISIIIGCTLSIFLFGLIPTIVGFSCCVAVLWIGSRWVLSAIIIASLLASPLKAKPDDLEELKACVEYECEYA